MIPTRSFFRTLALGIALCCAAPAGPAHAGQADTPRYVDSRSVVSKGPDFFKEHATPDNPEAAFFTGYSYIMNGFPDKAFRWIRQAADSSNNIVDAWYFMGYLYSAGMTPDGRDMKASEEWFQKAADTGHIDALNQLYFIKLLGKDNAPNPAAAYLLGESTAEKGSPVALNNLGVMYEFGIGVEKNLDKAISYYRRSADAQNPSAHFNLGRLYESGKGVEQNTGMAAQSYLIAADLGYGPAQYRVGQMMRDGTGFTRNYFNALDWLLRAGKDLNPDAMFEAGQMLENGQGAKPNIQRAKRLYEQASEVGHIPSIMRLGDISQLGLPKTEELRDAYSWYHLAYLLAEDDDTRNTAMDAREKIAGGLSDDERAQARRQAELRQKNIIHLQDAFAQLADGVTIDMFANPGTPKQFPVAMLHRALHADAPADNKN